MKNNKKIIFIVILNILIIGLICSFINIKSNLLKEKQIIKEMSESTQVSNLQTQINTLNKEHTDYANYIQTCKRKIASAITEMGIETSENAPADTMANNIKSITTNNSTEFYLLGTPYKYSEDGGISTKRLWDARLTITRNSQSACGINFDGVDLTNYRLVQVNYSNLTGCSLQLFSGPLASENTKTSAGTLQIDVTEINTTARIRLALGGGNGSVIINSLKLIP